MLFATSRVPNSELKNEQTNKQTLIRNSVEARGKMTAKYLMDFATSIDTKISTSHCQRAVETILRHFCVRFWSTRYISNTPNQLSSGCGKKELRNTTESCK